MSENTMVAFVEGRLAGAEVEELQRHIARCSTCHALLASLAAGLSLNDSWSDLTRSGQRHSGSGSGAERRFEPPAQIEEYRILGLIGSGSMGCVYLGHDTRLDRPVAIKFLTAVASDAQARERFLVEARAIARIQHPNVVAIHRIGQADDHLYLVSELVRGRSLDRLAEPLPFRRILEIGIALARGLGSAHQRGVLHRDFRR